MRGAIWGLMAGCALLLSAGAPSAAAPSYDLVILHGRIMDPETGADRIANLGVRAGRIAAISDRVLDGARTIDAKGLVVAPGFIDLHSHAQYAFGYDQQAQDGVTTSLELEEGVYPIAPFYAVRQGNARINFGASVGLQSIRVKIKTGMDEEGSLDAPFSTWGKILPRKSEWAEQPLSPAERERERTMFDQGFAAGGLGLGVLSEYLPGAGRDEIYLLMKEAGRLHAPVFVHARAAERADADNLMTPMQELVADAAATGASVHICHIGSKALSAVGMVLDMIDGARRHGVDVTTEVYPYDASSTAIGSALFNPGWQERLAAKYEDIEWPPTGERLNAESFARYRKEQPGMAIVNHRIPDATVTMAVAHPGVIIASDAIVYVDGKGHPRATGTFARVLGVLCAPEARPHADGCPGQDDLPAGPSPGGDFTRHAPQGQGAGGGRCRPDPVRSDDGDGPRHLSDADPDFGGHSLCHRGRRAGGGSGADRGFGSSRQGCDVRQLNAA